MDVRGIPDIDFVRRNERFSKVKGTVLFGVNLNKRMQNVRLRSAPPSVQ